MTRLDLFKNLPRYKDIGFGTRCVEVGTLQGDFAKEITDARPDIFLFCVDTWSGKFAPYREKFFKAHASNPRISVLEMDSLLAAEKAWWHGHPGGGQGQGYFDCIYIDAAHDYASVKADLEAWWPVVKSGGILAGHDFETKPDDGFWGPIEVQAAVLDWAAKLGLKVNKTDEHDCPSWWVTKT